MIWFVAFLSSFISFIVLFISRKYLAGNEVHSGDTFFHLLISKSIRNHKWKYPSSMQNVIFDEAEKKYNYLKYPPLFHYVVAVFPVKFHLKAARFLNLVVLCSLGTFAGIFSYTLTSQVIIAIFSSFIVVFNMAVFELEVMFTPRPLGLLFYSLVAFISIFYSQSPLSILAIPLLVALIILTHKFAFQILIFSLLPYAVIFNKSVLLLGFALGVLFAIIISKGGSLKILKEHISWLYFYSRFPSRAPYFDKLKSIIIRNFWYIAIIFSCLLLFYIDSIWFSTKFISDIFFWTFIPLAVALLVSIPYLSFLGEDYRYIEYSIFPAGIASSLLIANSNVFVLLAFLTCFFVSILALYKYKILLHKRKNLVNPDDVLSYQTLRNYSLGNLLVFPHTRTLEVNYFTGLKVVHPVRSKESMTTSQILANLLSKYEIRHVLKFKSQYSNEEFETLKSMVNLTMISDFNNLELYEISTLM